MIPKNHPRHHSLMQRHLLEEGLKKGIVTPTGLIAQGRGEAFDYLIGEKTTPEAKKAIEKAKELLQKAKKPIISVNGNTTAICKEEIVKTANHFNAGIEINLFYRTEKRIKLIEKEFLKLGKKVYGVKAKIKTPGLESKRTFMDKDGIYEADVVMVMLEDGDRTESLKKAGKKIIAIDLNPLSRTAQKADITIVDNVTRALPLLREKKKRNEKFNNKQNLSKIINRIRKGL